MAIRVLRAAMVIGLLCALRYVIEIAAVPLLIPARQQQGWISNLVKGSAYSDGGTREALRGWQLTVRFGLSFPASVRHGVRFGVAATMHGAANVQQAIVATAAWVATALLLVADAWTFARQWVSVHAAMVHQMIAHWITSIATMLYAKILTSVQVLFNARGGPAWVAARPWAAELSSQAAHTLHAFTVTVSWVARNVHVEIMGDAAITAILIGSAVLIKVAAYYAVTITCRMVVLLGAEVVVLAHGLWKRVFLPPPPPPMSPLEAKTAALVAARRKRCLAAGVPIASGGLDRFRAVALKVVSLNRQANLVALLTKQKRVSVKFLASAGGRGHLSSGVPSTPATSAATTAPGGKAGIATGASAGSAAAAYALNAATLGEWGRGAIVEMRDPKTNHSHHHHHHSIVDKKAGFQDEDDDSVPRLTGYALANCGGSLDVRFPLRGEAWALAVPKDKLVWPEVVLPSALTAPQQPMEPTSAHTTDAATAATAAAAISADIPTTPLSLEAVESARSNAQTAQRRAAQTAVQAEALSMAPYLSNQEGIRKKKRASEPLPLGTLVEARWRGALGDTSPATIVRAVWDERSNASSNGLTPEGHHSLDVWIKLGAAVSSKTSRYERALKTAVPGKNNAKLNASSVPEAKEKVASISKKQSIPVAADDDNYDDDKIAANTADSNASKNVMTSSTAVTSASFPASSPKARAAMHSAVAAFTASGAAHKKARFKEQIENCGAWRYDVHYADGSGELAVADADLRQYYPYYVEDLGVKHKAQGRYLLAYDPDYHTQGHAHSLTNILASYSHSSSLSRKSDGHASPRSAPVVVEWDWFWLKATSAVAVGLALVLERGKDYWNANAAMHPNIVAAYNQAVVPSVGASSPLKQQQQKPRSSRADADAGDINFSTLIATSSRAVVTYVAHFSVRLGAAAAAAATLALEPTPGELEVTRGRYRSKRNSATSGGRIGGSSSGGDLFSGPAASEHLGGEKRGPWFAAATLCVSSHGLKVISSTIAVVSAVILIRRVVAVGGLRECLRHPGLILNGRKRSTLEKATTVATAGASSVGTSTKKGNRGKTLQNSGGLPTGEVVRFSALMELEGLRVFVRHRGRAIERAATIQRAYVAPMTANIAGQHGANVSSRSGRSSSKSHGSSSSSVASAAVRAATVAASAFQRLQHRSGSGDTLRFDVVYDSGITLTEQMHEHHRKPRQESETSVPASCLRVAGPPPKLPVLPPPPPKNSNMHSADAADRKEKADASPDSPSSGAKLFLARAGASLPNASSSPEGRCPAGHPTTTSETTPLSAPCSRCFRKLLVGAKVATCSECHVSHCAACVRHLALPPRAHGSAADRPLEESEAILKGASKRKKTRFVNYVGKTSSVLDAMQSTPRGPSLLDASQMHASKPATAPSQQKFPTVTDDPEEDEVMHLSQMATVPSQGLKSRFSSSR